MTPQERDLILGVAQRLRNANLAQKDADAERLILAEIGSQRDALYLLTQAVIVQEQGLRHAQERLQQLEASTSSSSHSSFLGNLFGGGSPQPAPAAPPPGGQGSGIGTFLGTAAAAAAGTVGAQFIYDSFRHLGGAGSLLRGSTPGGFTGVAMPTTEPAAIPQDTDSSGAGGDFGAQNEEETFDAGTDDANGGGDFGDTNDDDDFDDDDSSDDDSQGGGDF